MEPSVADALALYEVLVERLPDLDLEWMLTSRRLSGPEEDAVKRREFVRRLAAAALLVPSTLPMALDLEHLTSPARLDAKLLDGWEALTGAYAALRPMQPPRELLPMVEAHLFSLRARVESRPGPEVLWRRLLSITAGTAAIAAWACLMEERRRDARAYLGLGEALAREGGDGETLMLLLMLRADLLSVVYTGGHEGLPVQAQRHLDEAVRLASSSTPVVLWAPLLLRNAEEHASAGSAAEALRYLEEGERVVANGRARSHYLRPTWTQALDGMVVSSFRGSCLQLLGMAQEAIGVLSAAESSFPTHRPLLLTDLAAAHAQQGDIDRACELLAISGDLVADYGLAGAGRRIVGVRSRHLARWSREPVVQALDERLALTL